MGYQALLFCPDEKTARSVSQVLSELDFTVIPCTEPFGAVKKLMGEHFDAVVVDCDNEQNATLLFKSARNTPANQSSLAVAVVEGQAGVAKAFRIGANLVGRLFAPVLHHRAAHVGLRQQHLRARGARFGRLHQQRNAGSRIENPAGPPLDQRFPGFDLGGNDSAFGRRPEPSARPRS